MVSGPWASLAKDIATTVSLPWGVHDQLAGRWVFITAGFNVVELDNDYPHDGLVVSFAGSVTHVDVPDLDQPNSAVVAVADLLQTRVMDEVGGGWPEYCEGGKFIGLLVPGLEPDGAAIWTLPGGAVVVRIGDLGSIAPKVRLPRPGR
jgi:hypothetical protein